MRKRKNPLATAPILRKGGVHARPKAAERSRAKKVVQREVVEWLKRRNP